MSLIDDALKRAQAAGDTDRSKPGDRPWIPTPMPDAGLARQRALVRWLSIALAAAVAFAAALIFIGRTVRQVTPLPAGRGPSEGRSAPAAAAPATPTLAEVIVPTPVVTARVRPTHAPRPASDTDAAAPASPEAAEEAPKPADGRVAGARNYVGSVSLPGGAKIELGGIVWSETEPRALLNDRILAIGGYVEGFNVTKIEEGRVALEKDGVTIYLSVK
jgi:uncharacterized lipoprotein YbaY